MRRFIALLLLAGLAFTHGCEDNGDTEGRSFALAGLVTDSISGQPLDSVQVTCRDTLDYPLVALQSAGLVPTAPASLLQIPPPSVTYSDSTGKYVIDVTAQNVYFRKQGYSTVVVTVPWPMFKSLETNVRLAPIWNFVAPLELPSAGQL